MKICVLARHIGTNSTESVGIGRITQQLVEGLIKEGHEVKVIQTEKSSLPDYLKFSLLEIPYKLPNDYDIYHAMGPIEALWLPRDRSVVTFMDLFQFEATDKIGAGLEKNKLVNWLGSNYYKVMSHIAMTLPKVVCISDKTQADVKKYLYNKKDIRVIRPGVNDNLDFVKSVTNKIVLGYLGVLDKRKRVDLLIDSFRRARANNVYLLIAGKGPETERLKAQAFPDERIMFLDYLPDSALNSFYNSITYFVFPSALEGYGIPIVEAMACKRPVIVMADAIMPQEIKNRCVVSKNLKSTIELLSNWKNVLDGWPIENNYMWAKEHSWSNMTQQYLQVYKELL